MIRPTRSTHLCLLTLVVVVAGGCAESPPVPREPLTSDIKSVAADGNAFAFDLYQRLREENEGNLFLSPYSISTAFAMTYAGARGETEKQMADALHFRLPPQQLHAAMGAIARDLDSTGKHRAYRLDMANRLWGQSGSEFLGSFLDVTRDDYGAEMARLDFAGDVDGSRQTINRWVSQQTNQRIQELLEPGVIKPSTALVLTNAIYFKGDWAEKFDPRNTKDMPFHVSADESVETPTMQQVERFRHAEFEDLQILELPYQGGQLSMLLVLPKQVDGLAAVEGRLSRQEFDEWLSKLHEGEVHVWLPRFNLTSEFELSQTLTDMGMPLPFSGEADFSGIDGRGGLSITAAVHQAFVEVNEEGAEAAAATGIAVGEAAAVPTEFRADHPFLFLIRDHHTGAVLFIGRLVSPST